MYFHRVICMWLVKGHMNEKLLRLTCRSSSSELKLSPTQTNTFQCILITDGVNSYTVFIYRCGYMEWSDEPTIIGFKTNTYFQNNTHSGNSANRIACANLPQNEWSNVLYTLHSQNKSMFVGIQNLKILHQFQLSKFKVTDLESQLLFL